MAIRLYVLRVFEQFSCTEDPVASNPYRTSRLRGEGERGRGEKGEEGEGGGGDDRLRSLERLDGERERSDSCSRALTVRNTLVTFLLLY